MQGYSSELQAVGDISEVESKKRLLALVCICVWRVCLQRGYKGDGTESLIPK